jgi:hypothetical protein
MAIYVLYRRPHPAMRAAESVEIPKDKRHTWTMPPLALLERPVFSPGRKAGMLLLRGYLVVAVLLLVIKTVQLGH